MSTLQKLMETKLIHGDKGLTVKFFEKDGKNMTKILIIKKPEGFLLKVIKNDETSEQTLSKEQLLKELKKYKEMDFATDYIKSATIARATSKKVRKLSRKTSKKTSKKSSKKTSKKSSKKTSKKTSKKSSKKGSRKSSRK
jgi:hypothetical protein